MDSKGDLRQQIRRDMKTWWNAAETRERALQSFNVNLVDYLKSQNGVWAGFQAMLGEPSLEEAIGRSGLRWVYPRVDNEELSFWAPSSAQAFVTGAYGIREPDPNQSQQIDLSAIDGFIIPGLAFDKRGGRLGKGKSFYDRALKNYRGIKVGVGFSWQVQETVPTDPWDIFMDVLVTDTEVIRVHHA